MGIATLGVVDLGIWQGAHGHLNTKVPLMKPRHLADTLLALATTQNQPISLLESLQDRLKLVAEMAEPEEAELHLGFERAANFSGRRSPIAAAAGARAFQRWSATFTDTCQPVAAGRHESRVGSCRIQGTSCIALGGFGCFALSRRCHWRYWSMWR